MSEQEDKTIYSVVVNHELQYSIWPEHREVPRGWSPVGVVGPKDTCLEHVERVWEDMRPTAVRIHMERLERDRRDRGEPFIKPPRAAEPERHDTLRGFKVADSEGFAFYTRDEAFRLAEGRELSVADFDPEPHFGRGLHFSRFLEDAVANGIGAAVWDDRYFEELKGDLFSSKRLHSDGITIFEVEAHKVVAVTDSIRKAEKLTVLRRVGLEESRLWPLVGAYMEWEENEKLVEASSD